MEIDKRQKANVKGYCRQSWASQGKLTKEISDQIDADDESILREILKDQKQRIIDAANEIENPQNREVTLTQADGVQETLDVLSDILSV